MPAWQTMERTLFVQVFCFLNTSARIQALYAGRINTVVSIQNSRSRALWACWPQVKKPATFGAFSHIEKQGLSVSFAVYRLNSTAFIAAMARCSAQKGSE